MAPRFRAPRGETDLVLDDFVDKLDPEQRAAGEKAAKTWLDALKQATAAEARRDARDNSPSQS